MREIPSILSSFLLLNAKERKEAGLGFRRCQKTLLCPIEGGRPHQGMWARKAPRKQLTGHRLEKRVRAEGHRRPATLGNNWGDWVSQLYKNTGKRENKGQRQGPQMSCAHLPGELPQIQFLKERKSFPKIRTIKMFFKRAPISKIFFLINNLIPYFWDSMT